VVERCRRENGSLALGVLRVWRSRGDDAMSTLCRLAVFLIHTRKLATPGDGWKSNWWAEFLLRMLIDRRRQAGPGSGSTGGICGVCGCDGKRRVDDDCW
jgi:hypothetical protein